MIEQIVKSGAFEHILVTKAGEDRATDVNMIADIFRSKAKGEIQVEAYENIGEAYNRSLGIRDNRTLIVTGSLYLVGEIKDLIF